MFFQKNLKTEQNIYFFKYWARAIQNCDHKKGEEKRGRLP